MKTRVKGNRIRRKCIEYLEKTGWLVDVVEKTGKFVKVKDLFGLFDLIAIKEGAVIFIQVTSNTPHNHHKLKEFRKKHSIFIEQFVWKDRKGFDIYLYYSNKKWERFKIGKT
mgnify:CR=1 FL=1